MTTRTMMALASSVLLFGCAHGRASLERWAYYHPRASQELGAWVQTYPPAAARLFDWDAHHPERSREFVEWSIYNPYQPIEAFVTTHPGWSYFDDMVLHHRIGVDAFMAWCRRHPNPAMALMNHPGGLDWAGHHLYASSWHLEQPGQ